MKRALFVTGVIALLALGTFVSADDDSKLPPKGATRFVIGGDSRDDTKHVVRWAFKEAKERGAKAFIFLGDMELDPLLDPIFKKELEDLDPMPFYPIVGNHEVEVFGIIRLGFKDLHFLSPEEKFQKRFLGTKRTPVTSTFKNKIVYSHTLAAGLHVVALDNVSQKGFGKEQLAWLEKDLKAAKADKNVKHIIVGMHKALAKNGVTTHAMEEDGEVAVADSDKALGMFKQYGVAIIFQSHNHQYAKLTQGGIEGHITGGLGAPLVHNDTGFHHFLQLDVTESGMSVTVVKFPGGSVFDDDKDDDEKDHDKPKTDPAKPGTTPSNNGACRAPAKS